MGRKRGGLAGIWDRNKKIIKPVVTGLAGVFGTPVLGAALGAAMGGFDRPGQSGIGFDAKQGAIGGLSGYGMAKLGGSAKDLLASKFAGAGSAGLPPAAPITQATPSSVGSSLLGGRLDAVGNTLAQQEHAGGGFLGGLTDKFSGLESAMKNHPLLLKAGEGALKSVMPPDAATQSLIASNEARRRQDEYELRRRQQGDINSGPLREQLYAQLAALMSGQRSGAASNPYAAVNPYPTG